MGGQGPHGLIQEEFPLLGGGLPGLTGEST